LEYAHDNEKNSLFLEATWSVSLEEQRGHSSASCRVTCFHFYRRHQVSAQVSRGGAGVANQPIYMAQRFRLLLPRRRNASTFETK